MGEEKEEQHKKKKKTPSDSKEGPLVLDQVSKFTSSKPVEVTIPGVFNPHPKEQSLPPNFINSTGVMIGGTISTLDNLKNTIQAAENSAFLMIEPNIDRKLTQDLLPIRKELESTKVAVEETSETLKSLRSFINSNERSLTNLISVEGKMGGLEGQVSSLHQRVETLETKEKVGWDRRVTILSLIVAVISACCGVAGVIVALFSYLGK